MNTSAEGARWAGGTLGKGLPGACAVSAWHLMSRSVRPTPREHGMGTCFEMSASPGGWAISPPGSGFRWAECSLMPSVPQGEICQKREFSWLQE